jgi:hypothetical protein
MAAPSCYMEGHESSNARPESDEIKEFPDAWERFEKAFDTVIKAVGGRRDDRQVRQRRFPRGREWRGPKEP